MSGDHYFTADPSVRSQLRTVDFAVGGRDYRLTTDSGVFSAGRLDAGTAVLLRKAPTPAGGTLLDLGCGYGPIACVLATAAPAATVYAVDVNTRARELTRANAEALGVGDRVVVLAPEDVPADLRFDQIWSNPPIRIGKADLHDLLGLWLPRLAPAGTAWLVVSKNLGGDSLAAWLTDQGWAVRREASQKGYRVLAVGKSVAG